MSKSISVNGHWYHQQLHNQCIFSMNAVVLRIVQTRYMVRQVALRKLKEVGFTPTFTSIFRMPNKSS